ncbi:YbaK/EbsC family protein [Cellulomonas sp. SLBN-39]|uniref:YbaK/EbsC family protein n=1 Tax=Cellulomonas sp. SLBN-39 TaxID=2768446 RepID=UPI0011541F9C|nr:YbaK/EbsC family protein [Cellulomonas sp. SLBN-39]TQL03963.1 prolyl-tRNA editing enzyme YbaK/EbsC (Cys-tRNA(Pro) deacylase) [Cellulomonas sp. SLBN-39]
MTTSPLGSLTWERAVDRPDLLAERTHAMISGWAVVEPEVADAVLVAAIDPDLADTAAMTEAYDLPLAASVNCVLVAGRREGVERVAACLVRATTRADVNNAVKRLLDVRKASFLPMERATEESAMEYGGITPLGLPDGYRVLADARVAADVPDAGGTVIIGSGVRRSKISLPGALLLRAPGVEVVDGLALA